MFGKSLFNKTKYNVTAPFLSLYVNMQANYDVSVTRLSALVDIGEAGLNSEFQTDSGLLYAMVPMAGPDFKSQFDMEAFLAAKVPLGETGIVSAFTLVVPSLKNNVTEEFNLENVFLAPGDSLVIDTDKLEIQIGNENLLEAWVSGGVFFLLKPGTNVIQFDTSPESCVLDITVMWADRYL